MTRLTDEQVAAIEAFATKTMDVHMLADLRALLDERRVLTQANAVLRAERDEALAAMPAEHADLALHHDALTRRCERLREALREVISGWTTLAAMNVARAALAADEKEG